MKILWVINIPLPEAAKLAGIPTVPIGGWLEGQLNTLRQRPDMEIAVLAYTSDVAQAQKYQVGSNLSYLLQPLAMGESSEDIRRVLEQEAPDIVHIFGTEGPHAYCFAQQSDPEKTLVTIQGVMMACNEAYFAGMPEKYKRKTPMKWIVKKVGCIPSLFLCYNGFPAGAAREQAMMQRVRHVSGRTEFDKAYTHKMAPQARYYTCRENLRENFYVSDTWQLERCVPRSIFVSQAGYPVKGFHMLLQALPQVLAQYPDTHVYVTGDRLAHHSFPLSKYLSEWLFEYQGYLEKLMRKEKIENAVTFIGAQNAEGMRQQYLSAHVFVSASSIENSPNSVGEAMMLGVPIVSSDVGGVSSMLTHSKEGLLYPFERTDLLAQEIIRIFDEPETATRLGRAAHNRACITHDRAANTDALIGIYAAIAKAHT